LGLQFRLETTRDSAALLIENCRNELDSSKFVQDEKEILANEKKFQINSSLQSQSATTCRAGGMRKAPGRDRSHALRVIADLYRAEGGEIIFFR